jgi:hypothetical protein
MLEKRERFVLWRCKRGYKSPVWKSPVRSVVRQNRQLAAKPEGLLTPEIFKKEIMPLLFRRLVVDDQQANAGAA